MIIFPNVITVPYEELEGSPTESFGADGFTATRMLKCAWANRLTLGAQLKGSVSLNGTQVIIKAAHPYPKFPGASCNSVDIQPFFDDEVKADSGDLTVAAYASAQLKVGYKTGQFDGQDTGDESTVLVSESFEPYAEFLTLPAQGFRWTDATGPLLKDEEAPGKLFKGVNWVYTIEYAPNIPNATLDLIGKVNSGSLTSKSLIKSYAAETLLYNPPVLDRQITSEGIKAWRLQYRFSYKPQGWNKFWRQDTGTWERIVKADGSNADPYEQGDFTPLINY